MSHQEIPESLSQSEAGLNVSESDRSDRLQLVPKMIALFSLGSHIGLRFNVIRQLMPIVFLTLKLL